MQGLAQLINRLGRKLGFEVVRTGTGQRQAASAQPSPAKGKKVRDEWMQVWDMIAADDLLTICNEALDERLQNLKRGLDDISRQTVDSYINRIAAMAFRPEVRPHVKYSSRSITDILATDWDRDLDARSRQIQEKMKAFRAQYDCPTSAEAVEFHSGLSLVPAQLLSTLEGRDAIDGGGFRGDTSIIFATGYPVRQVFCFEPVKKNYETIERNIARNSLTGCISALHLGLFSSEGTADIRVAEDGASSLAPIASDMSTPTERIDIVDIDSFAASRALDIGLIKLDVEGVEYDAILGAEKTIRQNRPILLISIYHNLKDFFEIKPLLEQWVPEYKFMIRHLTPYRPVMDGKSLGTLEYVLIAYPDAAAV